MRRVWAIVTAAALGRRHRSRSVAGGLRHARPGADVTGQTPWPTYDQCMSLERAFHLSHRDLVSRWAERAGRSPSGWASSNDEAAMMLEQVAEITGRQHKPAPTAVENSKPDSSTRLARQSEEIHALIDHTLVDIERGRFQRPTVKLSQTQIFSHGLTFTHEPTEPKGPIALRLHLWWMRLQLRWMLLRLDGTSPRIAKTLREYA